MRCELGVYINEKADHLVVAYVMDLARKVPGADVFPVTFPLQGRTRTPEKLMMVGGESSVNALTQYLYDRGQVRPVGLLPGSGNNVTRGELIESRATATFEQFMDKGFKYDKNNLFKPLVFRGMVANNQFGFGRFERAFGYYNEVFRGLPYGRLRTLRAAVDELVGYERIGLTENILDIYSVVPHIGKLRVFPNQDRLGTDITHARIEGGFFKARLSKLYLTLLFWQAGMTPPKSIIKTEQSISHQVKSVPGEAWIDGFTKGINPKGDFLMRRSRLAIPFMAIVPGG